MHVSDSALYAISHISHCTVTVCTWSYRHGHRGIVVSRGGVPYFVYQSACDHYRNLQLSFAKNTAAIEKWNMLYDSFILNFNSCM